MTAGRNAYDFSPNVNGRGPKCHYLSGYTETSTSTAYLDDRPLEDGSRVGVNKHTGLPVHLRWDDAAQQWVMVCDRQFDLVDVYNETYVEVDRPACVCQGRVP